MRPCCFNARYLILMRRMLQDDRNLLVPTRKLLVKAIDDLRHEHTLTGCPCWNHELLSMDTPAKVNLMASEKVAS